MQPLGPWAGAWRFFNAERPDAKHQIGSPIAKFLPDLLKTGKLYNYKGKR
jgi:hypothetical protein